MANIKLNLPAAPFSGQIVTFPAPCGCDEVTDGLSINGEIYTIVDGMGICVTGRGGAWCSGAQVSVVLDVENKKAYIQNPAQGARIATGSYVGTGKYGKDNPNTLTFEFVPKVIWVGKDGYFKFHSNQYGVNDFYDQMFLTCPEAVDSVPVYATNGGTAYEGAVSFSVNGRTVSWHSQGQYTQIDGVYQYVGGDSLQLNNLGETYHYFAIG